MAEKDELHREALIADCTEGTGETRDQAADAIDRELRSNPHPGAWRPPANAETRPRPGRARSARAGRPSSAKPERA